jgi:hypothetical protein
MTETWLFRGRRSLLSRRRHARPLYEDGLLGGVPPCETDLLDVPSRPVPPSLPTSSGVPQCGSVPVPVARSGSAEAGWTSPQQWGTPAKRKHLGIQKPWGAPPGRRPGRAWPEPPSRPGGVLAAVSPFVREGQNCG